jgi:hypothetical protein
MIVPRTDTGRVAEKAKVCWENPIQGNRQIGPVCSLEGVPVFSQGKTGRSDKEEATV